MFRRTGLFLLFVPLGVFLIYLAWAWLNGARAQDNNPFSGATSIRVTMVRDHRPAKVRAACSACLRVIRPENARRVGLSSK
jgi:hypothetical protein